MSFWYPNLLIIPFLSYRGIYIVFYVLQVSSTIDSLPYWSHFPTDLWSYWSFALLISCWSTVAGTLFCLVRWDGLGVERRRRYVFKNTVRRSTGIFETNMNCPALYILHSISKFKHVCALFACRILRPWVSLALKVFTGNVARWQWRFGVSWLALSTVVQDHYYACIRCCLHKCGGIDSVDSILESSNKLFTNSHVIHVLSRNWHSLHPSAAKFATKSNKSFRCSWSFSFLWAGSSRSWQHPNLALCASRGWPRTIPDGQWNLLHIFAQCFASKSKHLRMRQGIRGTLSLQFPGAVVVQPCFCRLFSRTTYARASDLGVCGWSVARDNKKGGQKPRSCADAMPLLSLPPR